MISRKAAKEQRKIRFHPPNPRHPRSHLSFAQQNQYPENNFTQSRKGAKKNPFSSAQPVSSAFQFIFCAAKSISAKKFHAKPQRSEEKSVFIRPTRFIRVPIYLLRSKINIREKISRKAAKEQRKIRFHPLNPCHPRSHLSFAQQNQYPRKKIRFHPPDPFHPRSNLFSAQ